MENKSLFRCPKVLFSDTSSFLSLVGPLVDPALKAYRQRHDCVSVVFLYNLASVILNHTMAHHDTPRHTIASKYMYFYHKICELDEQ